MWGNEWECKMYVHVELGSVCGCAGEEFWLQGYVFIT